MNLKCPYCKSQQSADNTECHECKEPFPWVPQLRELQTQMKERETSRFRASSTFAKELLAHMQGGPKLTTASVLGLINAWILPRTVIYIGSMLGFAVLCIQTVILWNQNDLLEQQSQAAKVEEADRTRERLARIDAVLAKLNPMYRGVSQFESGVVCEPTWECDKVMTDHDYYDKHSLIKNQVIGLAIGTTRFLQADPLSYNEVRTPTESKKKIDAIESDLLPVAVRECLADTQDTRTFIHALRAVNRAAWNLKEVSVGPSRISREEADIELRTLQGLKDVSAETANNPPQREPYFSLHPPKTVHDLANGANNAFKHLQLAISQIHVACSLAQQKNSRRLAQLEGRN